MRGPFTSNLNSKGFSLLELAVSLVIVGLLAGGGGLLFGTWGEAKRRADTREYMEEVRRAIITFARVNQRLPYPDAPPNTNFPSAKLDGIEDIGRAFGFVPYVTLGVRPNDAWGRRLKYHVSLKVAGANSASSDPVVRLQAFKNNCYNLIFNLGSPYVIKVRDWESSQEFPVPVVLASGGWRDSDGVAINTGDPTFDRLGTYRNDGDTETFVSSPPTGTFDDLIVYLDRGNLYNAMGCYTDYTYPPYPSWNTRAPVRPMSPP